MTSLMTSLMTSDCVIGLNPDELGLSRLIASDDLSECRPHQAAQQGLSSMMTSDDDL